MIDPGSATPVCTALLESAPVIVLELGFDGTITYANPHFESLMGCAAETFLGEDWFERFIPPRDRGWQRELFASVIEGARVEGGSASLVDSHGKELMVEWFPPTLREGVEGLICMGRDVSEMHQAKLAREQAEAELRRSQDSAQQILDQVSDAVVWTDLEGTITNCNRGAQRFYGYTHAQMVGQHVGMLYPPHERAFLESEVVAPLLRDGEHHVDVRVQQASGELAHGRLSLMVVKEDDRPTGLVGYLIDMSERVAAAERQRTLVHELDHRVKNTLAVVRSLACETAGSTSDLGEFRTTFLGRIDAMVSAHEALAENRWAGLELRRALTDLFGESGGRVEFDGPDVSLSPEDASPLCLALNELATNARKHGALTCEAGRVRLSWRQGGPGIELVWRERGGPAPSPSIEPGFGLTLIRGLVEHEIGGALDLSFLPTGLEARLSIPLRRER